MGKDYGERKPTRYWLKGWPAILCGLLAAAMVGGGVLVASLRTAGAAKAADAIYWSPQGPPCQALTASAFAALHMPVQAPFAVGKASFARAHGHADCIEIPAGFLGFDSYSVCQFTGPGAVMVSIAHGDFYFAPAFGHPATVSTKGGRPTCVQAANFKG